MSRTDGRAVAITGGLACGKSEVGRILRGDGVAVLDADDVARDLMQPGTPVYREVVGRFGPGIVAADGSIDRAALGDRVFRDDAERCALNERVHPAVMAAIRTWLAGAARPRWPAAVIIPLLFEIGAADGWSAIVCVAADEDRVRERLRGRGLSDAEARRRLAAQWPVEEKIKRSQYVIENNDTLEALAGRTRRVWQTIVKEENPDHA
jgi:dephospho-CoA kinase